MIGSRSWRALMRRNLIYRCRNILGTLLEVCLPIIFVGFLVLIKSSVENSNNFAPEEKEAYFPTNTDDVIVPFNFGDYVTAMQVPRKCQKIPTTTTGDDDIPISGGSQLPPGVEFNEYQISGIIASGYNWQVPFVKCDSRRCTKDGEDAIKYCEYLALGVAPTSQSDEIGKQQSLEFRNYIYNRYPQIAQPPPTEYNNNDNDDNNNTTTTLPFDFDVVKLFNSDNDIEKYVTAPEYNQNPDIPKLAIAIVFNGTNYPKVTYNYNIRVNSTNYNSPEQESRPATTTTPPTNRILSTFAKEDIQSCPDEVGGAPYLGPYDGSCTGKYFYNGVIPIQRLVNDFIIENSGAKSNGYFVSSHGTVFVPFPSPSYVVNGFYAQIAGFAPLLITLGLLYPVAAMVRYLVLEKELRQKELMKMMSVKESDIGWSWFVSFFVLHVITAIGTGIMSKLLYEKSSAGLLFFFWLFTFMAIITFTMFLGSLFSMATRATLVTLLIFFVGYFLTLVVNIEDGSTGTIALISLHPVGAFAFGLQEIGRLEDLGVGLTPETFTTTDSPSGYTFANTLQNLLFDCIFWGVCSWYTNRIARSEFGRPLPWFFPCTMSYWCPGSIKPPPTDDENDGEPVYDDGVAVEPVSNTLKEQAAQGKTIEIRKLRKVFGEKTAVDGLSLSMYNGQITALLGHNGAGKTTTISMLTGMLAPTDGYATVNGKDIRTDMENIRSEIGICLQHDCLFPELTVFEHIDLFSRIKGLYSRMSAKEARENIDRCIQDVALAEKRNTLSKNLSGGMKRKLSVAIAFCGDSKTVLLDEPTSGMDPFSRRFTWNVIRQYRQDRCIILTTHFMDEADILGDRIAIMAEGTLRCLGSSLFLKKTYGVGYQLTIEKLPPSETTDPQDALSKNIDDRLSEIVKGSVEEATPLTNVGTEISFQLPIGAASNFTSMFELLDAEVDQKNIVTYGVGITTLDEVFLLVARGDTHNENTDYTCSHQNDGNATIVTAKDEDRSARSRMDLEQEGLFTRHIVALFRKRAMNFKRDRKAWCCTTILPSLFVLFGFLLTTISSVQRELEPLTLTLDALNPSSNADPRNPITFSTADEFSCQPGNCVYEFPVIFDPENPNPEDIYFYCGAQSYLGNDTICTIEDYENVMDRITEAGAEAVGGDFEDVNASSHGLAESAETFEAIQYGAVLFTHELSSTVESESLNVTGVNFTDLVVSTCLERKSDYVTEEECLNYAGIGYVIQYNFTAVHVSPLFQTLADEAIVREALNDNEFTITTTIDPLPFTDFENGVGAADDAFIAWFLIILGFPFITGSFATFVVAERESKAKHLQTVAGVKPPAYWFSTWLWDIANYQIPCWITVVLALIFDVEALTNTENGALGGIIVLLILFGPAAASFTYCVTFAFSSPSVCNMFVIIFGFLIGMGGTMASFIMRIIGNDAGNPNESLILAADIVTWVCRFIPAFNLSNGIFNVINIDTLNFVSGKQLNAFDTEVMLYEVIFLAWQSIVYLLLAMKIDEWSSNPRAVTIWQSFVKIITCQFLCSTSQANEARLNQESAQTPDDDDVVAEKERIANGQANDDLIVLDSLSKVYGNGKVAVNNMSLGIPPGQCFGLLGINGAGKTTTMAMLTAEFPPTSGDATLAGYSVTNEPEKTRRRVGYCPQFDAHFSNLTGREHIELYASIKGVPVDLVKEASASKLAEVGLSDFDSDRLSAGYSGGMKRRLSLACATIGQPQIVFLDECSTGVDPVARREIWKMISDMVTGGSVPQAERTSVILTTHSMEECEALCPRIGIMAGGKMRCLGSAQSLKSKFGQGFQLEMKVKNVDQSDEDYLKNIQAIASAAGVSIPEHNGDAEEGTTHIDNVFLSMEQTMQGLSSLTGDEFLTSLISDANPAGFLIYKDAISPAGVDIDSLTSFATSELRMRDLQEFIAQTYPKSVLRERQDTKVRYEISSEGLRIANIFASIEEQKESLLVAEYSVSQTSLEQVFNMHAEEAERLKQGTNDA